MKKKTITTITVTESVWRELKNRKNLGDTMDDVLRRVLGLEENKTR